MASGRRPPAVCALNCVCVEPSRRELWSHASEMDRPVGSFMWRDVGEMNVGTSKTRKADNNDDTNNNNSDNTLTEQFLGQCNQPMEATVGLWGKGERVKAPQVAIVCVCVLGCVSGRKSAPQ